ncbi:MAG: hypothetical protein HYW28_11120 [Rhodospirillales bacterium]|nr:hypothetical protein [Rhodospirillales bacterium]
MGKEVGQLIVDFALAALSETPGGSVLSTAIQSIIKERLEAGRDILIEELESADRTLYDVAERDALAAILYRYARAAQEGAARLNLRLMAKVVSGQARLGNLIADEFLYYADLLASLRREEIIFIATLHKVRGQKIGREFTALAESGYPNLWHEIHEQLIPSVFPDEPTMRAAALAIGRTGLVMSGTTMDGLSYFTTSPLMDKLLKLASFDDALKSEG